MAKQKPIEQDGEVIEALPNAQFRVRLENGHEILGLLSGKMRMYFIKRKPIKARVRRAIKRPTLKKPRLKNCFPPWDN